jgi:hypothetical protein
MRVRYAWFVLTLFTAVWECAAAEIPRTAQSKPNFTGIWQVQGRVAYDLLAHGASDGIPAGPGIVEGNEIPYQPWAAEKKLKNFASRKTDDPLENCYFPGVPRIMLMEFPFQILQTPEQVAITFEWSHVYRLIYTNGKPPLHPGIESWMGNSRGRWEGDTLVVDVTDHNGKTWFDMTGNFHSDALRLVERYQMLDADTIQYEVTITDPKVFTKPWKIKAPLVRQKKMNRILEHQCQAEKEEASGAFERDPRTWYPQPGSAPSPLKPVRMAPAGPLPALTTGANLRRLADGKPDLNGFYESEGKGANYGLEAHEEKFLNAAVPGVLIDPANGRLPYQAWARAERIDREEPYRGYDDPTAHCFAAGVPRSVYIPSPFQIVQQPGYMVMLFERMSWRLIPLDGRAHIPDNIRLWQGDSVGHWEGDTLVVDTANLNGKTWLNEVGDIVSHAEHVVERFTPVDANKIIYRATVTDPLVYTRPWTIQIVLNRGTEELLEVACHEDDVDLQHLKYVRDEFRAKQKKTK